MATALSSYATVATPGFDFRRPSPLGSVFGGHGVQRPMTFREYVDEVTHGRFDWHPHNVQVAGVLQRVADDKCKRVMLFEPPRHGKSEQVSRLFSAYYLYRHPARWVGLNSYAAELAYTLSRAARENFLAGGGTLKDDAAAVKHWEATQGGGLWAAGVGGPITGKGFHLGIIDDPLKNAEEAASETIREKQKEWYRSTFYTREEPGGAIILVMTRWHEDDLAGWLLSEEAEDDEPERWHVVHFDAIKEAEPVQFPVTCTVEPDPREVGEPLCAPRYSLEKLSKIARRIGAYFWAALFQGRPRPKSGGLFKWDAFKLADAMPVQGDRVRYWDTAGTEGGGDYSVGALLLKTPEGLYYVLDVARGQWSPHRKEEEILETARRDAERYGRSGVTIWLEHEAGIGGKERTQAVVRKLAGHKVEVEHVTGSKEARAEPFASQVEAGNVFLPKGASWINSFRRELCDFPHAKHDDQVDAASGAFNKLALKLNTKAKAMTWRV